MVFLIYQARTGPGYGERACEVESLKAFVYKIGSH